MRTALAILLGMSLVACTGRQAERDIANSAQAIENAAASLPDSPQVRAIRANAQAIGKAVGHPLQVNP